MYYKLRANKTKDQSTVPFEISFNGTIANSIARILNALCRLIEGTVDWIIWKLKKKHGKIGQSPWRRFSDQKMQPGRDLCFTGSPNRRDKESLRKNSNG